MLAHVEGKTYISFIFSICEYNANKLHIFIFYATLYCGGLLTMWRLQAGWGNWARKTRYTI